MGRPDGDVAHPPAGVTGGSKMTAQLPTVRADADRLQAALADTLAYCRERSYVGYDKHDGMSSRIRRALPVEHKWLNLAFQESVKRAPVNLRPYLLVEQRPVPKGQALFLMANANTYAVTGEERYLREAETLTERVLASDVDGYEGFCLPYAHELQTLSETLPRDMPDVVATSFGVKALVTAADLGIAGIERAREAADFLAAELPQVCSASELRICYKPTNETGTYTLNANALAARLYLDLYEAFGDDRFRDRATRLLRYVVGKQSAAGGWPYTDPSSASHLSMDNYHNGFIVESLLRYQDVVDDRFDDALHQGLTFYRRELFEDDGAPRWDETSRYPRDVHAAAQGIVVFTAAGEFGFARRVADWTLEHLYDGEGRFYYQRRKYYTKRFTLMRWCQAWMACALSTHLRATTERR